MKSHLCLFLGFGIFSLLCIAPTGCGKRSVNKESLISLAAPSMSPLWVPTNSGSTYVYLKVVSDDCRPAIDRIADSSAPFWMEAQMVVGQNTLPDLLKMRAEERFASLQEMSDYAASNAIEGDVMLLIKWTPKVDSAKDGVLNWNGKSVGVLSINYPEGSEYCETTPLPEHDVNGLLAMCRQKGLKQISIDTPSYGATMSNRFLVAAIHCTNMIVDSSQFTNVLVTRIRGATFDSAFVYAKGIGRIADVTEVENSLTKDGSSAPTSIFSSREDFRRLVYYRIHASSQTVEWVSGKWLKKGNDGQIYLLRAELAL